jgi:hypothetical protein
MRPHNVPDLAMASVAFAIDARLAELGQLTSSKLAYRVALELDIDTISLDQRRRGLLISIPYTIDMHGRSIDWHDRGLALSHIDHTTVLVIPENFLDFLQK